MCEEGTRERVSKNEENTEKAREKDRKKGSGKTESEGGKVNKRE